MPGPGFTRTALGYVDIGVDLRTSELITVRFWTVTSVLQNPRHLISVTLIKVIILACLSTYTAPH